MYFKQMFYRFFWICLFLFNGILCEQFNKGNQGLDIPQSFGFYRFQTKPVMGSVQPGSGLSAGKSGGKPSYSEPVKGKPTASEAGTALTQENQVQVPQDQASLEYPYVPWRPSSQLDQNRMPENQAVYLPTFSMGYNAMSQTQAGQEWAPPSATDMGQQTHSISQAAKMPAAPTLAVPARIKVPAAPVSQVPVMMTQKHVQVSQAPVQVPQAPPLMPQAPAHRPQNPVQMPQAPASVSSNPIGSHGNSSTGGEATSTDVEGPSSGPERYLTITAPSGFQTRYIVRSFNRYVRGKRVFSQTTYIPLDFPPSEPAAPPVCCQFLIFFFFFFFLPPYRKG
ncbi:hypothetical protein ACEWY4_014613 [Coilia grayii]|uniref:Uncharacterized protein n=1 Tax=Coilia grayii TaxID=363190 RepID=A0ABD1JST2_9TELE